MKYFLHDTNAFQDEKITELFMNFGYEGVGLFFTILEKLAMQEKPMKTEVLKKQLFVGKKLEKAWNFMEQIELISSNNGETFNEQLLNFSEKYQIKKEKTKEKVSQWRKNQQDKKNVTSYETVRNQPKVKESKVKESKVNNNTQAQELNEFSKKYFHEKFINEKSLDVFEKLLEIDNYTYEQISLAISWGREDPFWSNNFLSPVKLRNKNKDGVKYIDVFLAKTMSNGKQKFATSDQDLARIISERCAVDYNK